MTHKSCTIEVDYTAAIAAIPPGVEVSGHGIPPQTTVSQYPCFNRTRLLFSNPVDMDQLTAYRYISYNLACVEVTAPFYL